jgi:predicted HTH transcriptional regulator
MTGSPSEEYLVDLVRELCKLPRESEWIEFKRNNDNPGEIGEYISALSNSAALLGKANAYLVWGVEDASHAIVGTSFAPALAKKGNEELESWLLRLLTPKIHFRFYEFAVDGKKVVLLEIERATRHTVRFEGSEYIRIGSYKKSLQDFPDKARELWRILDWTPFEDGIAAEHVGDDEVSRLLDYPAYFELLEAPLPADRRAVVEALACDRLIRQCPAGAWNITNLGAILFAKRLSDFGRLQRKAIRVIQYKGVGRVETLKEQEGGKGYASGFEGLLGYINGLLPANEVLGQALRKTVPMFPPIAVRELVANALIHQDFLVSGSGPMVEIFDDRIEITNPGEPLVDTMRFVDTPPTSRNETLASLMRRFRICEERGSGIDKVVNQIELYQLPAPLFEVPPNFTRVTLFAHKGLNAMDKGERIRACYLHACLRYVTNGFLTNTTIRERFGIEEKNSAIASRIIKETVDAGLIAPYDADTSRKLMKYAPCWALPRKSPEIDHDGASFI